MREGTAMNSLPLGLETNRRNSLPCNTDALNYLSRLLSCTPTNQSAVEGMLPMEPPLRLGLELSIGKVGAQRCLLGSQRPLPGSR